MHQIVFRVVRYAGCDRVMISSSRIDGRGSFRRAISRVARLLAFLLLPVAMLASCGGGGGGSTGGGGGGGGGVVVTYTLSGTVASITPGATVTLTLSGGSSATTTANASGNYSFAGLSNGTYTITPTSTSLNFAPANASVTINGANMTGVNFTATAVPLPTYRISGTVGPTSLGAGVTVTLTGASNATVTTDASGNFSFNGLANGSYTITPSGGSLSFTPTNRAVTVNGGDVASVNFTASTVAPPTFTVSGAISPTSLGVGVQVALSGASTATATADSSGNFSFPGLVNGSYTVTPSGTGLAFTPASRAVTVSGSNVTAVNFAAATTGGPPTTYTIAGTVSPSSLGANVTVTLTGALTTATTTDASGNYSFTGLANGAYAVTPSGTLLNFTPPNRSVTINGANATSVNFTASAVAPTTFSISGTVSPSSLGAGAQVTLSGAANATATADGSGNYTFAGLSNGSYTVTPSGAGLGFTPTSRAVTVNGSNVTAVNFTAATTGGPPTTYTVSGTISPSSLGSGAVVTLSGASSATTTANASGVFSFTGLANGSYTVTPSAASVTFTPANRAVTVNGSNVSTVNFTASAGANVVFFDDFSGTSLSSDWTALDRAGPPAQLENLCNKPSAVTVSGGVLTITTTATPSTCGDAVTAPSQQPYTSGSIQWTNLNFTYGTVEIRGKFPPQDTKTWPAFWLLGSNCQAANIVNGSEAVEFMGCPAQNTTGYREIDMVECDTRSWCHMVVAQGTNGWSSMCAFPVDANWHVYSLTWTSSAVSVSIDGSPTGCSFTNTFLKAPMFLIIQTQTTTAGGVGGLPNNAKLPTTLQVDYVRVTQP